MMRSGSFATTTTNSFLVALLVVVVVFGNVLSTTTSTTCHAIQQPSTPSTYRSFHNRNNYNVPMYIVFGRPGAGKSTVADAAVQKLQEWRGADNRDNDDQNNNDGQDVNVDCLALDLDVCVPDWMKENFGKGIYPTLEERIVFAKQSCDYVDGAIKAKRDAVEGANNIVCVVSFSFVNTDLRDVFRSRFPNSEWILIHTTEDEATNRINQRKGHFYTGEKNKDSPKLSEKKDDNDNSDWKFAPVDFPHIILDGRDPIDVNANKVLQEMLKGIKVK
jgi:gluconate kinase